MKTFLIFASIVAVGNAGVGRLTPAIEAEAYRLWQRHCAGASEGGAEGNSFIYCKKSRDVIEETQQHQVSVTPGPQAAQQVVFVQPPSYHYRHDVLVTGGGGSAPKTIIYVKPQKNTHEVNVDDRTTGAAGPQKPTLYFLKADHGGSARGGFGPQGFGRLRRDEAAANTGAGDEGTAFNTEVAAADENKEVKAVANPVVYVLQNGKN